MMTFNAATCTPVSGENIHIVDLARSVPEFAAAQPDAIVGYTPTPGSRRVYHANEVRRLAQKYGVSLASDREACFVWPLRRITDAEVSSAMRESLAVPSVRIEVLEVGTRVVPEGKLVFPLTALNPAADRNRGPALWRGYVQYSQKRRFDFWARVKLSAPTTRVVAVNAITPGQVIESADVRLETVEDYPIWHEVARHLDEVVGKIARRGINAGVAVLHTDLSRPVEVAAGEVVDVDVQSGMAHLKLQAKAENSGSSGDMISVRNPRTGKVFRAQVEAKGRVLVMPGVTGGAVN